MVSIIVKIATANDNRPRKAAYKYIVSGKRKNPNSFAHNPYSGLRLLAADEKKRSIGVNLQHWKVDTNISVRLIGMNKKTQRNIRP